MSEQQIRARFEKLEEGWRFMSMNPTVTRAGG